MRPTETSPDSVYTLLFIALAFGFTWGLWIPEALESQGATLNAFQAAVRPFSSYGAWGPLVAALIVTATQSGTGGLRDLWRRTISLRYHKIWLLPMLLLFPLIIGLPLLLVALTGEPLPAFEAFASPAVLPIAFFYILFLGGPLQEEHGWRGYLLEQLQRRWNVFTSSIIVGITWGCWHLPLFFMASQKGMYYERPFWGLLLSTTLVSILFAWLYNRTGKNLLLMLVFHTVFNFSHYVFPMLQSDTASLWYFVLLTGAVIAVVFRERALFFRAPHARNESP